MDVSRREAAAGYLLAMSSTGLVASARYVARDTVGDGMPLLPFVLSVMVTAWYAGRGPGLLATALGTVVGVFLFVPPFGHLRVDDPAEQVRTATFVFEGVVISCLCGALHAARRAAEAHAADALDKQRQLEEAARHKNEFLATLAHELRNPLAAARYAADALRPDHPDPAAVVRARGIIDRAAALALRLVDDLADLTRISRRRLALKDESLDLAAVVAYATESARPVIDGNRHRLTVDRPPHPIPVRGDEARLTQVVLNLLTNSAKYTPEGGDIRVAVTAEGVEAVVRVRDNGLGIPPDQLPRIFGMFTQVERNLARSEGGLGIGLALVRNLVGMHGGTVRAFSDGPGTGCEFVVRLPLGKDAGERMKEEFRPAAGSSIHPSSFLPHPSRKVLVVDDNRDAADSLATLLRLKGHEVRVAYDGPAGLVAATDRPPDVAFLDIGLPGISGYDLARRLRE